ncbi:MAG: FAD-dependent oxidoreductase [Ferruginibacter sp.]
MNRDGALTSLWQSSKQSIPTTAYPADELFDVAIIGAGITGLSTAISLQKAGKKCIVLEAANIGFGTSGGTTAHLNTFFDSPYNEVIDNFGEDNAKLLAKSALEALTTINENISAFKIDCGYDERTGYVFSVEEKQNKELDKLVEATQKVGLPMGFINDNPFPIPYIKIAAIEGQAQFNPTEYLFGLADAFTKKGGVVIENCRVTDIEEDETLTIVTAQGKLKATHAVYATHIPPGVNILHFRNAPYRSYAMAVTLKNGVYPQALGYDMCEPYHYYRSQKVDGQEYLIAGGEDHKTGHEENTDQCFRRLESYLRKYFEVDTIAYKWSSQYYQPTDGLPYIGHLAGNRENIFCATGYNGNGMIYGTLAGNILRDLIIKNDSIYKELFKPARVKPVAGFVNFVKEAADVVTHFVGDKISPENISELTELAAGEARVVKYEGHTLALYKDDNHKLYAVNSACTHINCNVGWNNAEKTWDCPCHGSRFNYDGTMLTSPARKDLEKLDVANL